MQTPTAFRTLIDLFNESISQVQPADKLCLEIIRTDRHEQLTFEQLQRRTRNFASWLITSRDIRVGDKIAILSKNRTDWDVAIWGIILTGAIPVLIDPERGPDGVIGHLLHTETRLLVVADDYQDPAGRQQLKEFASSNNIGVVEMTDTPLGDAAQEQVDSMDQISARIDPEDTAVILCTSGTTGDPREVELTHANLVTNIEGSLEKIIITGEDRLGHILPPHHSFGMTVGKMLALRAGATNYYTNVYRQISQLIADKQITIFIATPALYTVLAKKFEDSLAKQKQSKPLVKVLDRYRPKLVGKKIIDKMGWTKLRFFLSGAAPMPKWVLDVFWRRGIKLYEGYGTTENSPVYGFNDDPHKLGSVGKPIPNLYVQITNDKKEILPPGEKGEICLGGPCIMKGYYKNPESTNAVIRTDDKGVRWLHTGDLGYLDDEGNVYITGRKKYLIVLPGGKNVNPELVESALSEAPFVGELLIVPGERTDSAGVAQETIRAIVQPAWDVIEAHANLSQAELVEQPQLLKTLVWQSISECQQKNKQLAHFEMIASNHLEIKIDEFQKTSTGKIRREVYMKA
ncbi:MAG: acyl--CoA ligase [Phycisphaerales bacterium]|nr:MAG: acyl--CoA ligase [Phycisphaerales bacterium]